VIAKTADCERLASNSRRRVNAWRGRAASFDACSIYLHWYREVLSGADDAGQLRGRVPANVGGATNVWSTQDASGQVTVVAWSLWRQLRGELARGAGER